MRFNVCCMKKLHGSYGTVVEHVGMAISCLSLFSSGKVMRMYL